VGTTDDDISGFPILAAPSAASGDFEFLTDQLLFHSPHRNNSHPCDAQPLLKISNKPSWDMRKRPANPAAQTKAVNQKLTVSIPKTGEPSTAASEVKVLNPQYFTRKPFVSKIIRGCRHILRPELQ
jgi:hypothetical protein